MSRFLLSIGQGSCCSVVLLSASGKGKQNHPITSKHTAAGILRQQGVRHKVFGTKNFHDGGHVHNGSKNTSLIIFISPFSPVKIQD